MLFGGLLKACSEVSDESDGFDELWPPGSIETLMQYFTPDTAVAMHTNASVIDAQHSGCVTMSIDCHSIVANLASQTVGCAS